MSQYVHLSNPDPEWAAVSAHIPIAKPIVSIEAYREEIMAARARRKANTVPEQSATEGLKVIEKTIQVENGEIRVRAYIPDAQDHETDGFPLILWTFGGGESISGFVLGSIDDEDVLLRNLSVNSRIVCATGDYRKAPEHPFPAAVNDTCATLKWALNNSSDFSINISKGFIVGGVSAGGNLAAVLAQRGLKDPDLKGKITGQLLVMPTVVSPHAYPEKFKSELLSFDKDENNKMLPKGHCEKFLEAYHGSNNAPNLEVSPLLAESFEGLPPAYIQVCGVDLLRDEAFLYERLLREAGVSTKLDVYPGLPHGFHIIFKDFKATKKQREDFVKGLDWLLHRSD
ncbi:hypothetical protein Clacol_007990 [Clathrus columnatus]|uniref:Alpha/beta hydrolase fold-3 domain-containing protein n=1 Tax=Clathrus columnatus TaxID=1419009 RepID=A0AAV5ALZ6_9AGAM|nr:hypothetical protein Clacol_007990 [Clathrus columnatus]